MSQAEAYKIPRLTSVLYIHFAYQLSTRKCRPCSHSQFFLRPSSFLRPCFFHKDRQTSSTQRKKNQTLVVAIGGFTVGGPTNNVEIYSLTKKSQLNDGASAPGPRNGFGNAVFNNTFYVLGGFNGKTGIVYDTFWSYDIVKDTWKSDLPKVPTVSYSSAAVELGGRIYVLGGTTLGDTELITDVYAFSTRLRKWYKIDTPIPEPAHYPCATVQEKHLWYMSANNLYHSDDGAKTWKKLSAPKVPREQADCIAVGTDAILFTGGAIDNQAVNTVELFNITTNKWKTVAPMNIARSGLSSALIPDSSDVLVCGGNTGDYDTGAVEKSCEIYDWAKNKWNTAEFSLEMPLTQFGLFTTQAKV